MDDESTSEIVETKLKNSQILQDMDGTLAHLSPTQDQQIQSIIQQHLPLFPDTPGITHVMKLDVDVGDAEPIRQHPYCLNPTKQAILFQHTESGHEQPVSYFFRKFHKHQLNYHRVQQFHIKNVIF